MTETATKDEEASKDVPSLGPTKLDVTISEDSNESRSPTLSEGFTSHRQKNIGPRSKRKKLEIACVYCRRSHMICDESRPCQRCIKRGIGNLCHDEPTNGRQRQKIVDLQRGAHTPGGTPEPVSMQRTSILHDLNNSTLAAEYALRTPAVKSEADVKNLYQHNSQSTTSAHSSVLEQTLPYSQDRFFFSEHAGNEFSSLNDFLSMIDEPQLGRDACNNDNNNLNRGDTYEKSRFLFSDTLLENAGQAPGPSSNVNGMPNNITLSPSNVSMGLNSSHSKSPTHPPKQDVLLSSQAQQDSIFPVSENDGDLPIVSEAARDKFFLTAADPTTESSPEERLKQVIRAKLEAGLLQPYDYARGYARLVAYIENFVNDVSRQRILNPLSVFRPAFRAIARTLKDVDLVLVEESFERMLLDYDRVFSSMAIPACLWRRTGEIYRGNKEFASLVEVATDDLKDGKLAIYELMSEDSAVNFWEKYGAVAFDKGQKAVLTSCSLRTRSGRQRNNCCFSFTIRRDRYNIPSCIVGNFIPIDN